MKIEVVYARADVQSLVVLELPPGSTLWHAIERSGLLQRFADIDLAGHAVGIFGRVCSLGQLLEDGDRVEIYRPLRADPKQLRRQRAGQHRTGG